MQGKSPLTSHRWGGARRGLLAMVLFLAGVGVAMLSASGVLLGQTSDPVFVGAGDIGNCNGTGDEATASLVNSISGTVFNIGDNAYPDGSTAKFNKCYDPTWGQFKARTKPSVGNREYDVSPDASGYFDYFGAAAGDRPKGYYSYDLGGWHIIVLNSNCAQVPGGCDAGSPQEEWLKADLAAHQNACSIAYFHHPRFSSGVNGNKTFVAPFWSDLYEAGAEVVLSGHDHSYERFAPQNPSGQADPEAGIREFVVGTGGAGFTAFKTVQPNSQKRIANTNGVLKMTLHPSSYEWQFITAPGRTVADSSAGSTQCHDAQSPSPTDTTAPAVQPPRQDIPTNTKLGTSTVPTNISWSATDQGSGVAGYEFQQSTNGGAFTNVALSSATSTVKTLQLQPGSTYQFRVRATDGAGNTSNWVAGQEFVVVTHQENSDASLVYGGSWTQQALSSAYGGGVRYATTTGSSAQFTFTGQNVAWVSTKGPDRGKATVAVDGVTVATVDLYASGEQARRLVFSRSDLDPAVSHTVTVQATGTKRSASTGTRVDVDAFVVLR
jgi:hypothetical protein